MNPYPPIHTRTVATPATPGTTFTYDLEGEPFTQPVLMYVADLRTDDEHGCVTDAEFGTEAYVVLSNSVSMSVESGTLNLPADPAVVAALAALLAAANPNWPLYRDLVHMLGDIAGLPEGWANS